MHPPYPENARPGLPSTWQLLAMGGGERIALDPQSGTNRYGCPPFPDPELAAFGSSTASVISTAGFAAADRLRNRLDLAAATETQDAACTREFARIRQELAGLCGLSDLAGLESMFASSGTETHALAAQLAGGPEGKPTLALMVDARETGSGVAAALSASGNIEAASVALRRDDGSLRPATGVDAEVAALATAAAAQGRRVLLILVDVSKTGLLAPTPACVAKLHALLPDSLDVLVDACQFRIAASTLRTYLEQGFMVALTGSKFITGPTFSGLLLIPAAAALRLRGNFRHPLPEPANFGLLLRWEAALAELRAFRALPESLVRDFLQAFAQAVSNRLASDPAFELLPTSPLARRPLAEAAGWDHIQTIFSFLLYRHDPHAGRTPLNSAETARISRLLQLDLSDERNFSGGAHAALRCQLGQPVACGTRGGVPVSALRLCVSARLVTEALAKNGKGATAVIERALAALDKTAQLAASGVNLPEPGALGGGAIET